MKKILFLQPGYAHYRKKLFTLLAQKHNVCFVYTNSKNVYPGEIIPGEFPHFFVKKRFGLLSLGIFYSLVKEKPDIVLTSVSSSMNTIVAYFYSYLFNKKKILWIEEWRSYQLEGISVKNILRAIKNKLGKWAILKSDSLIATGRASYNYALSIGKKDEDIFVTLQCSEDIASNREKSNVHDRAGVKFLYLSRIIDWKGLDFLLRAFSMLENDRNDVSLIVAGDGPFRKECEGLVQSLMIKRVTFVGNVDPSKVGDIFSSADVFVLPSCFRSNAYEAWGLVVNEALSMSLPVITTTAVGSGFDMINNYKNGIIVDDSNVTELYKAMKTILDMDLINMGKISREIFEKKNSHIQMSKSFSNAIAHVQVNYDSG